MNGWRQKLEPEKWSVTIHKYLKMESHLWKWVAGSGWNRFEVRGREGPYCHEWNIKGDSESREDLKKKTECSSVF